jgi:hypothetical protein
VKPAGGIPLLGKRIIRLYVSVHPLSPVMNEISKAITHFPGNWLKLTSLKKYAWQVWSQNSSASNQNRKQMGFSASKISRNDRFSGVSVYLEQVFGENRL